MLRIQKGPPPRALLALRATPGADWGSVHGDQKREILDRLLAEQGHLCAYCSQRIHGAKRAAGGSHGSVEHWQARSSGADPFEWTHLLAVCTASVGRPRDQAHCDTRRGDRALRLHPAHPSEDVEGLLGYHADGRIVPRRRDPGLVEELDEVLGLNIAELKQARAAVVTALERVFRDADLTRLHTLRTRLEAQGETREPFAGVSLYFLRRRIQVLEQRARRLRKRSSR